MAEGTCLGLGLTQSKELVAHIIFVYGKFEFICILCTLSQICCLFVLKEKINLKKKDRKGPKNSCYICCK